MSKAIAIIENPDSIVCTLSFTMKISDWKQIRKTLRSNSGYTELQVISEIDSLVYLLEKTLYSTDEGRHEDNQ